MSEVASAYVSLIPSYKGGTAKISKELGPSVEEGSKEVGVKAGDEMSKGIKSSLKNAAKAVAGTFLAEKAFDFFKDSAKDADEYRKITGLTAAAIKSTGGAANVTAAQVGKMSEELSYQDGVSKGVAQSAANMLLHYNQIRNVGKEKIFDEATKSALDLSAATGTNATAAAKQLGKALQSPTTSLSALTRSGITFTAAQAKQIQGMAKAGNLLGAQKAILKQVATSYGGAAAASATPMARLKNQVNELQLSVGSFLIPKLDSLARVGTSAFAWAQEHTTAVKVIGLAIGVLVGAMAVEKIIGWVEAMREATVVTGAWSVAQTIFNAVMAADPLVLIIVGLVALGAALVLAYNKSATFRSIVLAVFGAVKVAVLTVVNALVTAFHAVSTAVGFVVNFVSAHWRLLISIIGGPIGLVVALITKYWSQIKGAFSAGVSFADKVFHGFGDAVHAVGTAIGSVVHAIATGVSSAFNSVRSVVGSVVSFVHGLPGKLASVAGAMLNAGKRLISSFLSGLAHAAGFVGNVAKTIVNSIIGFIDNDILGPIKQFKFTIGALGFHHTFQPFGGLPTIPYLAKGGIIPATAGGQLFVGGEAGQAEAVIPIDRLDSMINRRDDGGSGVTNHWTINEATNAAAVAKEVARRQRMAGVV